MTYNFEFIAPAGEMAGYYIDLITCKFGEPDIFWRYPAELNERWNWNWDNNRTLTFVFQNEEDMLFARLILP